MGYGTGEFLSHLDWKQIGDPKFKLYAFQGQSEGEFSDVRLTPDWKLFKYDGSSVHGDSKNCINNGGICSIVKDKVTYTYRNEDYYSNNNGKLGITPVSSSEEVIVVDYLSGCGKLYKVKLSELKASKYNADSNVDFKDKIFSFYANIDCGEKNNVDTYNSLNDIGKKIFDENKIRIPEEDQAILLNISKIAQEFDIEVYNSFVDKQKNNGAMFWRGIVNNGEYTREKLENTYQAFINYSNALDKLYNYPFSDVKELVEHVKDHFQITKGSNNIFAFPSDLKMVRIIMPPFKQMSIERKKQLTDLLSKGSYAIEQNIGNDVDAGLVLSTIFTTTDYTSSEALDLVNYVIDKGYLKHFVEKLYGYQYDTFIKTVNNIAFNNLNAREVHLDAKKPNFIKFTDALLGTNNDEKLVSSKELEFTVTKWFSNEKYFVKVHPLDPVIVEFDKNISLGGKYQFLKGQMYPLPAIMVYDLFWQDTKSARWKSAQLTGEVALTALGVGEVVWAVRAYRVGQTARATYLGVKAAADMGVGFTDIYLQNTDVLTEEQLNRWNKFVFLYAVGSFSTSAVDGLVSKYGKKGIASQKDFEDFEQALKNNKIDLDAELNKSPYKNQIEEVVKGADGAKEVEKLVEEIERIKDLRKTNSSKRIEELGKDLDKGKTSLAEGKAGFEIEEKYGYFERFKSTAEKKGDWISLSGDYKGKTFDEFGGELGEVALSEFARKPSQKAKFFKSIDLHFTKADYVVLNLTEMKRLQPSLYEETLNYISTKFGEAKLINISK